MRCGLRLVAAGEGQVAGVVEFAHRIGFGAYAWHPSLKLYHVRQRDFHAGLGVWMQRDPIG